MAAPSSRLALLPTSSGLLGAAAVALAARLLVQVALARRLALSLGILAVRGITPLAVFVTVRSVAGFLRDALAGGRDVRRLLLQGVTLWCMGETLFFVYFWSSLRWLNSQTTRRWQAVTTHSTEEKRKKTMERYLLALTQVCSREADAPAAADRRPGALGLRRHGGGALTGKPPSGGYSPQRGGSWGTLRRDNSGVFGGCNPLGGHPAREQSVNDLLKLWEGNETVTDEALIKVKWCEISCFFTGPGCGEAEEILTWLQRGNVEEWIAHYWFRGATPEELERSRPRERAELRRLTDFTLENTGLTALAEGRNVNVRAIRCFTDPLPVLHRPLAVYLATSLLCPFLTVRVMSLLGFHRERIGGLSYWHRPPCAGVAAALDIAGPRQMAMVYIHGLGVGLVPYYVFICRLSRHYSGELFVPELPFLACAPWESVPSAREVVAQLQDMLSANGHTSAHFVGHSFGAIVVGWMMKMSPTSVVFVTLMEPANFLMMKSETFIKVLYHSPKTCFEIAIRYLTFRELFTVNLLCRNFFWEQSTFWPEDLHAPAVIELAADDAIVHGLFVRRLLEHERAARKQRRKLIRPQRNVSSPDLHGDGKQSAAAELIDILWCEGFNHGEILFRLRSQDKLFSKMRQMAQGSHGEASAKSRDE